MVKKIDWARKLTSRKFWAAVVGFVTPVMVACGATVAGATLIAYIIGEGMTDAAAVGKEPEAEERVATK